jgi:hypothetical protein
MTPLYHLSYSTGAGLARTHPEPASPGADFFSALTGLAAAFLVCGCRSHRRVDLRHS